MDAVSKADFGSQAYWKVPLPVNCIHFVDAVNSEEFVLLRRALNQASIIALDAEWKPVRATNADPRVSILQVACRLRSNFGRGLYDDSRGQPLGFSSDRAENGNDDLVRIQIAAELNSNLERECLTCDDGGCRAQVTVDQCGSEFLGDAGDQWHGSHQKLAERPIQVQMDMENGHKVTDASAEARERSERNRTDMIADDGVQITSTRATRAFARDQGDSYLGGSRSTAEDSAEEGTPLVADARAFERDEFSVMEQIRSVNEANASHEVIFLLDLLALPASALSEVLKAAFVNPMVLKIGFGFKHDLVHLRGTLSGPDSRGCFDKVGPYLDVGKLYLYLNKNEAYFSHRGKRIPVGGGSLSSISSSVLGLPLRKDMQCSNWEQRPLTAEQFDYAAIDAYCLLAIFDALQVKASSAWFSPVVADEDTQEVEESSSQSRPQEAGLLSLIDGGNVENDHRGTQFSICHSKRGNAVEMVGIALDAGLTGPGRRLGDVSSLRIQLISKTLSIETLVRRFGEILLVSEAKSITSKRGRKKPKGRAREGGRSRGKQQLVEDDYEYVGHPPWDAAVGGDGIPKFLCDAMVEGLARQLRCVGIDAASLNSKKCEPRKLLDLAKKEGRVILTEDMQLLRRRVVPAHLAYRVQRRGKWDQLAEVIEAFKLSISEEQLLSRCTKCNGKFVDEALSAKEVEAGGPWNQVIPECALENNSIFWQCSSCKHIYWQGSQFTRAYEQFIAVCRTRRRVDGTSKSS